MKVNVPVVRKRGQNSAQIEAMLATLVPPSHVAAPPFCRRDGSPPPPASAALGVFGIAHCISSMPTTLKAPCAKKAAGKPSACAIQPPSSGPTTA
jgi:hypothetical protein